MTEIEMNKLMRSTESAVSALNISYITKHLHPTIQRRERARFIEYLLYIDTCLEKNNPASSVDGSC